MKKTPDTLKRKPFSKMTKDELFHLSRHYCEHKHTFLDHPACFRGFVQDEKIGFLDIECSDLNPGYGIMTTYCIKEENSPKIYMGTINKKDIAKWGREAKDDTRLVRELINDMENFDRLVTHYGSRFDLSFIRSRALICGVKFPEYGVYVQTDTWQILKTKFNALRGKGLENSTRILLGSTEKTHLTHELKNGCIRGEEWALKETLEHNVFDVKDTERLYHAIAPYHRSQRSSI